MEIPDHSKMNGRRGLLRTPIPREETAPGAFMLSEVERHNQSVVVGSGPIDITTPPDRWAFAASFPFRWRAGAGAPAEVLAVRVEAKVHSGRIGIGCVANDLQAYVSKEVDCGAEDGRVMVELLLESSSGDEWPWLVVRNTAEGNQRSRVTVFSIETFRTAASRIPDLVKAPTGVIPRVGPSGSNGVGRFNGTAPRQYRIALTHTSRQWDSARCAREDIIRRYADPNRLLDLPPFEELGPPPTYLYSGGLSLLDMAIDRHGIHVTAQRCIDSPFKIQHATFVGARLVLCFESFLAVLPTADTPLDDVDLRPGSPMRIDDNWFSGLHTIFPVNDDLCIVSSSGCDAVLWVDVRSRKVVRRWRLPADIYGVNYDLTPGMPVNRHYIPNDLQLGHLNCAYPDGHGGCYVSTLAQGDIGHVDADGRYSLLARGYAGCHGVRAARDGRGVYFSDSCTGQLLRVEADGSVRALWSVNSRWLHDVEQVDPDLYLFCLGDRNEVAVVDVTKGEEKGRFSFDSRGVNVQFVSVVPDG